MYIGQTIYTLDKRRNRHILNARNGVDTHFYRAIRKYGEDSFIFEIIDTANSKDELNKLETYYISKYDSIKTGYNMVDGGNNNVMFIPDVKYAHTKSMRSQAVRNKISKSMRKYREEHPFTEEHRAKLSKSAMGNHNFGTGDTRSIECYCVDERGIKHYFHSYLDAGKWWYAEYKPFPYSTCTYQRKIKQSIECGYSTYGRNDKKQTFLYPKWFRKIGDVNEKVTDKKTISSNVK